MRILVLTTALVAACGSSHTARGAREGAAQGAVAGAAGGLLSSLIFGGDPVERAARGAAWGAGAGAAGGAMAGGDKDRAAREKQRQEANAELAKLRKEIGDDSYKGLEALADCKHSVALAYAETAAKSTNKDYALAALWLEVLVYADKRDMSNARKKFPELVTRDKEIQSTADAEKATNETIKILRDIREEYGLPRDCD